MGYRSEVILAIMPEVMPQFMVTMAKSPQALAMCWKDHTEMIKDYCEIEGAMLFRWDEIKWYDSYEGVQAILDFMDWCETEMVPTAASDGKEQIADAANFYRFVRIGEDADDTDLQGWGFDIHIETRATY